MRMSGGELQGSRTRFRSRRQQGGVWPRRCGAACIGELPDRLAAGVSAPRATAAGTAALASTAGLRPHDALPLCTYNWQRAALTVPSNFMTLCHSAPTKGSVQH